MLVGIQLTYKRDNFGFDTVNFPFMSSNIPAKPTYGVYISQLIRIGRICDSFSYYTTDLYCKLCACLRKFAKRYSSLFRKHGVSMKRHIWEGICIPRHDLKRNVTARGRGQCAVQRYKQT